MPKFDFSLIKVNYFLNEISNAFSAVNIVKSLTTMDVGIESVDT